MKRRTLPIAVALTTTAALLLTACGGGSDSDAKGQNAGARTESTSASASASTGAAQRPDMTLPSDVTEAFESWKVGDATKDTILTDAGHAQTAVTYSVTKGDPESPALSFYQTGTALAGSQDWVKEIVDAGLTYHGSVRYYAPDISVLDAKSAGVSYCADESKAYNKNRKTNKVDEVPATEDSYVLYSTRLEKNSAGVWQTTKLESERGNQRCLP